MHLTSTVRNKESIVVVTQHSKHNTSKMFWPPQDVGLLNQPEPFGRSLVSSSGFIWARFLDACKSHMWHATFKMRAKCMRLRL